MSECVTIDSCPSLLNNPTAPATTVIPCGFDEQQSVVKICCPEDQVTEPRVPVGSMIIRYKSEKSNHEYLIKMRFSSSSWFSCLFFRKLLRPQDSPKMGRPEMLKIRQRCAKFGPKMMDVNWINIFLSTMKRKCRQVSLQALRCLISCRRLV